MAKNLTNKGEEIYWRAKQSPSFGKELNAFRKKYRIPDIEKIGKDKLEKLLTEKHGVEIEKWYLQGGGYIQDRITFLQKYGFPITDEGDAMDALLYGHAPHYSHFEIEPALKKTDHFIKLVIWRGATRKETIDFIKNRWKLIDPLLNPIGIKNKRVRRKTKKEVDEIIWDLWQKTKQELLKEDEVSTAKEILIRRRLLDDGIERTPDAIKDSVERMRRLAKVGVF